MKKCVAIFVLVVLSFISITTVEADIDYQYAQVTTQKGPLNMRKTASTKAKKIEEIPKGTIITIVPKDDTWAACTYNDQEGYVMIKYLSIIDISQFRTLSNNDSGQGYLQT